MIKQKYVVVRKLSFIGGFEKIREFGNKRSAQIEADWLNSQKGSGHKVWTETEYKDWYEREYYRD